jgi:RES domain-containing protein
MEVYRIVHNKWSDRLTASGLPARWNSAGIFIIYTAASRSLACLENIVHMGSIDLFKTYVTVVVLIPDDIEMKELAVPSLPDGWSQTGEMAYLKCRSFGDRWAKDAETAILKVPSAIVPFESNYLINPGHPDFSKVSIVHKEQFSFDQRIKKTD